MGVLRVLRQRSDLASLLKLAHNDINFRDLRSQVQSRLGVIPFVGAGLSVDCGIPAWTDFLSRLAPEGSELARTVATHLGAARYEEAAEALLREMGALAFRDAIRQSLDSGRPSRRAGGAVFLLPAIAAQGPVFTTNFDEILESVFESAKKPFKRIVVGARRERVDAAIRRDERYLIKIHGDLDETEDRVLTTTEYERHYGAVDSDDADLSLALPSLLATAYRARIFLFLGCSLGLDRTVRLFSRLRRGGADGGHFAILPLPPSADAQVIRERELGDAGIRPIFYPTDQHACLLTFLHALLPQQRRLLYLGTAAGLAAASATAAYHWKDRELERRVLMDEVKHETAGKKLTALGTLIREHGFGPANVALAFDNLSERERVDIFSVKGTRADERSRERALVAVAAKSYEQALAKPILVGAMLAALDDVHDESLRSAAVQLRQTVVTALRTLRRPPVVQEEDFVRIVPGSLSMRLGALGVKRATTVRQTVEPFRLLRHEVTNAEYEMFDPTHAASANRLQPVTLVSWFEAYAYAAWRGGDLPSDAQWEWAARSTHAATGWFQGETKEPQPVGTNPSAGPGPVDMLGNVWEWCRDWYVVNEQRAMRGGSFQSEAQAIDVTSRQGASPDDRSGDLGFRIILPLR